MCRCLSGNTNHKNKKQKQMNKQRKSPGKIPKAKSWKRCIRKPRIIVNKIQKKLSLEFLQPTSLFPGLDKNKENKAKSSRLLQWEMKLRKEPKVGRVIGLRIQHQNRLQRLSEQDPHTQLSTSWQIPMGKLPGRVEIVPSADTLPRTLRNCFPSQGS